MPHATWQTQTTNHPNCLRTYLHTLLLVPLPCPMELVLQRRPYPVPSVFPRTYIHSDPTLGENILAQHLT